MKNTDIWNIGQRGREVWDFREKMEGPASPWGLKNKHYAYHFTAHDDDDDDIDA